MLADMLASFCQPFIRSRQKLAKVTRISHRQRTLSGYALHDLAPLQAIALTRHQQGASLPQFAFRVRQMATNLQH